MDLSIIIPTYNEEKNIKRTIVALTSILQKLDIQSEVIIVCDGCTDSTYSIAKPLENDIVSIHQYAKNQGKGKAIKYGFKHSNGNVIAFFDAGLDFPPTDIVNFYNILNKYNIDGVIGSKRHKDSQITYPLKRRIISKTGQIITKTLFSIPYSDTQVGIKIFTRDVLDSILPNIYINQYAFDIEMLVLSYKHNFRIAEAPVTLHYNPTQSGVNWKTIYLAFLDTLRIYKYLRQGRYRIRNEKNSTQHINKR